VVGIGFLFLLTPPATRDKMLHMMKEKENMSNLPESKSKTLTRKRVIINKTGLVWNTWWTITKDGTLVIDPNYHSQYKAGEWRFIIEREVKTITYEENEE
jgi:hypothetical protein